MQPENFNSSSIDHNQVASSIKNIMADKVRMTCYVGTGAKKPNRLMLGIAEWRTETISLTAAERGALISLKLFYWQKGAIPDRDQSIAQIVGMELKDWKKARRALEPLFVIGEGEWIRTDWNEELEAAYAAVKKACEASQQANKVRWDRQKRRACTSESESESDPSSLLNNKGTPPSQAMKVIASTDVKMDQTVSMLESQWQETMNA